MERNMVFIQVDIVDTHEYIDRMEETEHDYSDVLCLEEKCVCDNVFKVLFMMIIFILGTLKHSGNVFSTMVHKMKPLYLLKNLFLL